MRAYSEMVTRVADAVMASMSPADRKKKVMEIFKRFKGMGDGLIRGGKHQIMLAAEGYETVVLEDASDEELNRLHNKYILGKKASVDRVADMDGDPDMAKSMSFLSRAVASLWNAEGDIQSVMDPLVDALKSIKTSNAYVSDADTESHERELTALIRQVDRDTKGVASQIRELRFKVKESVDQFRAELEGE